jgi:16S rRNA (cytosine967-C5)-methyltransferase
VDKMPHATEGPASDDTRQKTLLVLNQYVERKISIKSLLREIQSEDYLEYNPIMQSLAMGVIRYLNSIDYILTKSLGATQLQKLDVATQNELRLAVFERRWNDAQEKDMFLGIDKKFHKIIRKATLFDLQQATSTMPLMNQLSLNYSHPTFITKTLLDHLPTKEVVELLQANNKQKTYYIRPNRLTGVTEDVQEAVAEMGVGVESDPDIPGLYKVIHGVENLVKSESFREGKILIQDKASVLSVLALNPSRHDVIWDACAAPGMKTQLIAEKMMGTGKLIASDVYKDRVKMAHSRTIHLNAHQIEWLHTDSTNPVIICADKILIDAPCTSTGILQTHPSFKWYLNKQTLFSLMTLQNKLLNGVLSAYQNRHGTEVVYSTCSILPHEGESQIDSALSRYGIELLEPMNIGTRGYPGFKCSDKVTRLFPHKHNTNGFFIARMRITS